MRRHSAVAFLLSILLVACGGPQGRGGNFSCPTEVGTSLGDEVSTETAEREAPPASGPRRDVSFPAIERTELDSGLEVNVVEWDQLPIVYVNLIVKSGGESDPDNLQGLSGLVADMLKEGTRRKTSAQLAEAVDFLGADLWTASDEENTYIGLRCLREHFDTIMNLLAEVVLTPRFDNRELAKLKRRERDRLTLQENDPGFLSNRAFHEQLYGDHPYARVDTTIDVVDRVSRNDLVSWHRDYVVPNNSVLVVVGDVESSNVVETSQRVFRGWQRRDITAPTYRTVPERSARSIVVVHRPESVQSVIRIGNIALSRDHEDFIPLVVANQVLGGSATSRLFQDLRQQRSLTYGAYSSVAETVDVGAFSAQASVRTEVTAEAVGAFLEHLERITSEAPPVTELADAKRYMSDRFPLRIDTPGKIATLIGELRVFSLPDDYWDTFRSRIGAVTPEQALAAAQEHIQPNRALVVVVGDATEIADDLAQFGPVTVINEDNEAPSE